MSAPQQLPLTMNGKAETNESIQAPSINPAQQNGANTAPAPVWLQRLSLGVLVIFCLYLGLFIVAIPWWKDVWDLNPFLLRHSALHNFLMLGPVRGLISGLGVLDLWIGISEMIHYRDYRS